MHEDDEWVLRNDKKSTNAFPVAMVILLGFGSTVNLIMAIRLA